MERSRPRPRRPALTVDPATAIGERLRRGDSHRARSGLALALYIAVSASTVAVPIVCTLVSPRSMEPRLVTWRERLSRSGLKVTASVMLMIGVALVGLGWSQV